MKKTAVLMAFVACAWIAMSSAQAQPFRTYLSNRGSDANDCRSPITPCQSFAQALSLAGNKGEIYCLDRGYFGPLSITISISVHCHGRLGQVGSNTIQINVGAGDVVELDGLEVDFRAFSGGSGALQFLGAGTLHLRDTMIRYAASDGIFFNPTGTAKLVITDSYISDNGGNGATGAITIRPNAGVTASVTIDRTRIINNKFGIIADGNSGGVIRGTLTNSLITGNFNNGVTVSTTSSNVVFSVDGSTISGNNFGLVATGSTAGMLVGRSVISNNNTGLSTGAGGVLLSYRDNRLNANTSDGAFTGPVGLQ